MKNKTLSMLLGSLFILPFTAFADNNYILLQNQTTDTQITVQYQYCTDYPHTICGDPINSPWIDKQTSYRVPQSGNYTYVVALQATTKDGWQYKSPQTGENCDSIKYYISGVPAAANFSKTFDKPWLQCEVQDGFAKKSK